jgi:hypothetical protein
VNPAIKGQSRRLGDLEPDRLSRLALDHRCSFPDALCGEDIPDPKADEVATSQLAVHGHVEQRQVARIACHLEADAYGPDMPGQKPAFLVDDSALVPRRADRTQDGKKIDDMGPPPVHRAHPSSIMPTTTACHVSGREWGRRAESGLM